MSRINSRRIYKNVSYTICELSQDLDVDCKTIFRWIDDGLKTVPESKRPIYIKGEDLKEFAKIRNSKRKVKLGRNQFYCFGCKEPRYAKKGSLREVGGRMTGKCRVCSRKMSRTIKPSQKDYLILAPPSQMSIFGT